MKLLLDQNLSPRLVRRLTDLYPNSRHVMEVGLDRSLDKEVGNYARQHEYLIVTKAVDFSELSLMKGFPPKVIWIRRGNCSTHDIETILQEKFSSIKAMNEDEGIGIIELF
jgi:predicted nuclease of predicted toxin-antitoxin system